MSVAQVARSWPQLGSVLCGCPPVVCRRLARASSAAFRSCCVADAAVLRSHSALRATVAREYSISASRCASAAGGEFLANATPGFSVIVNGKKAPEPKIVKLADEICALSLLESAELNAVLKVRLVSRWRLLIAGLSAVFGPPGGALPRTSAPISPIMVYACNAGALWLDR